MPGIMDKVQNQFMKKKTNVSDLATEAAMKLVPEDQK